MDMCLEHEITPEQVLSLAQELGLGSGCRERLAQTADRELLTVYSAQCIELTDTHAAEGAWQTLKTSFYGADPDGMKMLAIYLAAACLTRQNYRKMDIPDGIFLDTMGCFPRFVAESKANCGRILFDRGFWAWRQLSCRIFRLGALEFEYRIVDAAGLRPKGIMPEDPILSVHIPSDARLTGEALRDSYEQADQFFTLHAAQLCRAGIPRAVTCSSWLVSPELRKLLGTDSGIARFSDDYTIFHFDPDDDGFYRWLFEEKKPPAPLPRRTRLQRAAAAHLKSGGHIGKGYGVKK